MTSAAADERLAHDIYDHLLREDFLFFVENVFRHLRPTEEFVPAWHIDALCAAICNVLWGHEEDNRFIANLPPRSLKSVVCSVALPVYFLGLHPGKNIICISYNQDLSEKHAFDRRKILEAPWYQRAFPKIRLFRRTASEIATTRGGSILSTSIGGTLTGRGGDLFVIDDPIKPTDAYSKAMREGINEWLRSTLASRPDDKRRSKMVLVMQRVHVDDPSGVLFETNDWHGLILPAIATEKETISLMHGRVYTRHPGEPLDPIREPLETLESLRRNMGEWAFQAQYQQEPVPPDGGMFKKAWFGRYDKPPQLGTGDLIVQSWDTAFTEKETADWSVGTTWLTPVRLG